MFEKYCCLKIDRDVALYYKQDEVPKLVVSARAFSSALNNLEKFHRIHCDTDLNPVSNADPIVFKMVAIHKK